MIKTVLLPSLFFFLSSQKTIKKIRTVRIVSPIIRVKAGRRIEIVKYYHATKKENNPSIRKAGIRSSIDGGVHCCASIEDCLRFMSIRPLNSGQCIAVIPFEWTGGIEESFGHNPAYIPCKAFVTDGDVPPECIPNLSDIPLFKFEIPNQ